MKLTSLTSLVTLTVVLVLVFAAVPGLALQPVQVDIAGRVVAVVPTANVYGLQLSLLYVRSGGMVYTLNCFECEQLPRGSKVVIHARLWSDQLQEGRNVLILDVIEIEK